MSPTKANKRITWATAKRRIDDLVPYEHNPRQLTEKQHEDLKKSLEHFDLAEIPAINKDNTIIAGHQRLHILQELGRGGEEVDVRVPSRKLTKPEVQEYNVRSNKNTGEWDFDILANAFEIEDLIEWGFDADEFGIDVPPHEGLTGDDEVPEAPDEPTCKTGDLWQLGDHRLLCGDATVITDVERLMDGEKADMVFTDPPYGVYYAEWDSPLRSVKGPVAGMQTYQDCEVDFESWAAAWLANIPFAEYNTVYIWLNGANLRQLLNACATNEMKMDIILVWVKNVAVLSRLDYLPQHELCVYGWKGKHHFHGKAKKNVLTFDKPSKSELHPTMKPVAMVEALIPDGSQGGEIVIDLFGGSGTTLIACQKTGRKCRMMEISPHYCDVIIQRWEDYTGNKAELV